MLDTRQTVWEAKYLLAPRWRVEAGFSRLEQSNRDPAHRGSDIEITGGESTLSYVSRADNSIGVRVHAEDGRFPNLGLVGGSPIDFAYRQTGADLVLDWTITGASRLRGRIGQVSRRFSPLPQRDFSGAIARAEYDWKPTGKLSLRAIVQRDISAYEDIRSNFVLIKGLTLRPSLTLSDKTELAASLESSVLDYLGDPGLAAGAALPWLLERLAGSLLPVPLRPGFYPEPLAVAALFGLLAALVFSLRELGAARKVPPSVLFRGYDDGERQSPGAAIRAAVALFALALAILAVATSADRRLALWFILGTLACFALFRALAILVVASARRAPRPRRPSLRLALANVHRRGSPAANAVFSLGLGLTALVVVALVQANLTRMVEETIPAEAPAFFFLDIQPGQVAPFAALLDSLPGVSRVERYPTLRGRIVAIAGVPVEKAHIAPGVEWAVRGDRFLSYAAKMPENTKLADGRWWPADYHGPPLLSLTADLAKGFGVGIGDTLTVNVLGREITARIESLREVDWSTLDLNFALLFSPGVLESAPQTHIASVYVPPKQAQAVFRAVTDRFPNVSAIGVRGVLAGVTRTLSRLAAAFRAMAAVALLSGFLVLSGAVSADQHRRIRDAVIFKVCGATRRDLLAAFAAEFLLLGLASGAISAVVGTLAAWAILVKLMHTSFALPPGTVLATLASGIGLTLALGLAGTWKALGQKPALWLREE